MPLQRFLPGLFEFGEWTGRSSVRRVPLPSPYDQRQLFRRLYRADQRARESGCRASELRRPAAAAAVTSHTNRVFDSENNRATVCSGSSSCVEIVRHGADIDLRAPATGKCHFGDGHRQATFAQVVAASHQTLADGLMQRLESTFGELRVDLGHVATRLAVQPGVVGTAQFVARDDRPGTADFPVASHPWSRTDAHPPPVPGH